MPKEPVQKPTEEKLQSTNVQDEQGEASQRQIDYVLQELTPAEKQKALLARLQNMDDDSESVETIFDESLQHIPNSNPEQPKAVEDLGENNLVISTPLQNKGINSVEESGKNLSLSNCADTISGHNIETPTVNTPINCLVKESVLNNQGLPSHVSNSVSGSSNKISAPCPNVAHDINLIGKFLDGNMDNESPIGAIDEEEDFTVVLSKSQRRQKKNKKIILQIFEPYNT